MITNKKITLNGKMFLSFLLFSLIPLIIISGIFIYAYQNDVTVNVLGNKQNELSIIKDSIDIWLNQYVHTTGSLYSNKNLNLILEDGSEARYEANLRANLNMQSFLMSVYSSQQNIDSICYVDNNGTITSITRLTHQTIVQMTDDYMEQVESYYARPVIALLKTDNGNKIMVARQVLSLDGGYKMSVIGKVFVLMDEEELYKIYAKNKPVYESEIYLFNENMQIISSSDRESVGESFESKFSISDGVYLAGNRERYFYNEVSSDIEGLRLVEAIKADSINASLYTTIQSIAVLLGLLIVLSFIMAFFVSRGISKPIKLLVSSMANIKNNNFTTKLHIKTDGTVDELVNSYNMMVDMLNELINENLVIEIKTKEAQLQAYERQVNPHFIYNTLDMIRMMSAFGEQDKVEESVVCLSKLLKFNNGTEKEVTIEEEIENIKDYFKIIKLRYGDEFEYEISVSDEIKEFYTLKFLLQPFIENAVRHGLEKADYVGKIVVVAKKFKDEIIFIIRDNGLGISKEKLEQIMDCLKNSDIHKMSDKNIGIVNAYQRIRLHYGDRFDLGIKSTPNDKTTIYIHIPVNRGRGDM